MSKKPTVKIGRARLRALKGPRPTAAGRTWLWRLEWCPPGGGGKQSTKGLGWATRAEAETAAAKLLGGGLDEPTRPATADAFVTVADLLLCWLAHQQARAADPEQPYRASSAEACRTSVLRLLGTRDKPAMGAVRLTRLSVARVEHHRDRRLLKGDSPRTIAQDLGLFRQACRWGHELGAPGDLSRLPRVRVRDPEGYAREVLGARVPTDDEVRAVIDQIPSPHLQLAILLLWATGARPSEVRLARRGDLDVEARELDIRHSKTGRRRVPLPVALMPEIVALLPDDLDGPLLGRELQGTTYATKTIRYACAALGQERWTAKGLRRRASFRLIEAGIDPKTYEALMGHTWQVGMRVYAEATDDSKRQAVEAVWGPAPESKIIALAGRRGRR